MHIAMNLKARCLRLFADGIGRRRSGFGTIVDAEKGEVTGGSRPGKEGRKESSLGIGLRIWLRRGKYCRANVDGEINSEGFFFSGLDRWRSIGRCRACYLFCWQHEDFGRGAVVRDRIKR